MNEKAILEKLRGGDRDGEKAQEAEREKGLNKSRDSNSVRGRQGAEGGWWRDREVDVSGHFL